MNLIKEEIKKIFSYRINRISCVALVMWIIVICIFAMLQESIIVDMNSPRLTGKEAIRLEMKEYSKHKGLLTNDVLNQYISTIQSKANDRNVNEKTAQQILGDKRLVSYQEIVRLINSTLKANLDTDETTEIFKVNTPINFYSLWAKKSSAIYKQDENQTSNIKPFYYDYSRGWQTMIKKFDDVMLGLLVVLAICFSNIFKEDSEQNMNAILLSSKYGRKQYVTSKILASLTASTILYSFSVLIFLTGLFIEYGTTGRNVSVQIATSLFYPETMNNFEAVIKLIFMGYISTIFMSFIIIFLSTVFKTSFKVAITSILICMIPYVFISFSEPNFLMSCCFPIVLVDLSNIFTSSTINVGKMHISQTGICIATVLLIILLMYIVIKIKLRNWNYKER